jgi:hypothetical protein
MNDDGDFFKNSQVIVMIKSLMIKGTVCALPVAAPTVRHDSPEIGKKINNQWRPSASGQDHAGGSLRLRLLDRAANRHIRVVIMVAECAKTMIMVAG